MFDGRTCDIFPHKRVAFLRDVSFPHVAGGFAVGLGGACCEPGDVFGGHDMEAIEVLYGFSCHCRKELSGWKAYDVFHGGDGLSLYSRPVFLRRM